jgi:YD repeat-containing protein
MSRQVLKYLLHLTKYDDAPTNSVTFTYDQCCAEQLTEINYDPDSDVLETFQHDAVGNMTNFINRASQHVKHTYDAADRLIKKE